MIKKILFPAVVALALCACDSEQKQDKTASDGTQKTAASESPKKVETEKPAEQPKQVDPYEIDNLAGQNVDTTKPVLITTQMIYEDSEDPEQQLAEYSRYDSDGKIIEYGCITGQFDYEGYIRMFKIYYNGNKIDSIGRKEIYFGLVDAKKDSIFQKGYSIFDQFKEPGQGFLYDADTAINDLDPTSIVSMRKYADSKNDILVRGFAFTYDFSVFKKWDKEKRDEQGRLVHSELKDTRGEEFDDYKIDYTYGEDFVKEKVKHKRRVLVEEEMDESTWNRRITVKYLHKP